MNSKIAFLFFAVIVGTLAEDIIPTPERYPPGVDPLLCPGYPNCDNELLHTTRLAVVPTVYYYRNHEFPPGVDPLACPNYPYCGTPAKALVLPSVGPVARIAEIEKDGKIVKVDPVSVPELLKGLYYVRTI